MQALDMTVTCDWWRHYLLLLQQLGGAANLLGDACSSCPFVCFSVSGEELQ